jgi:hypothetical protein
MVAPRNEIIPEIDYLGQLEIDDIDAGALKTGIDL